MRTRINGLMCGKTVVGVLAVAVLALIAHGMTGQNGYSAAELFQWGDIRGSIQYGSSFSGVEWDDMASSGLGERGSDEVVADSNGTLYYLAFGDNWVDTEYTGLVRYDGTSHVQLMQDAWMQESQLGEKLIALVMAPVTHGRLTADHPVVIRWSWAQWGAEVVSVNPSTGAETVVYNFEAPAGSGGTPNRIALDADGRIFALFTEDNTIHVLEWDGSDYDESVLSTSVEASSSIRVGGDGYLYTFNADQGLWLNTSSENKEILRINPDTGASSVYGHVKAGRSVQDWAFDAAGQLWVAHRESSGKGKKRTVKWYVTPVVAGGVTSSSDAIGSSSESIHSLAAGPAESDGSAGPFYVLRWPLENGIDRPGNDLWQLTPSADGGGGGSGGNGGGNGNGKGKNK